MASILVSLAELSPTMNKTIHHKLRASHWCFAVLVSLTSLPSETLAQDADARVLDEYGESPKGGRTIVSIETRAGLAVPVYLLERKKRLLRQGSRLTWTQLCVAPCTVELSNGRHNLGLEPKGAGSGDALELGVEALGEPIFLRATHELPRRRRLGTTTLWVGGAVSAAGLSLWLYGQSRQLEQVSTSGVSALGAGVAVMLAGVVLRELARPSLKRLRTTNRRTQAIGAPSE